jgi:hypothetical protein
MVLRLRLSRWILAVSSYEIDGASTTKDGAEKQGVRQIIREEIRQYLQDPLGFPEEYKGWLPEWITQAGIDVPISQIVGFSGFTAQAATPVATQESSSSTTYTDLATVGPQITGLPDGQYLLLFGLTMANGASTSYAGVKINSTDPADADAIQITTTSAYGMAKAVVGTLDGGGNNTVKLVYRSSTAVSAQFALRWLVALKVSNA